MSAGLLKNVLRDPERAQQNLVLIAQRVPPAVSQAIPLLLADSPDPDSALNLFERLAQSENRELFRLMEKHQQLIHYALAIFGYSQFLGETLIRNQDLFSACLRERNLDRSHSPEEFRESFARYRSRSFETDISVLLARFKRREYVRIVLRDVLGIATLAETTAEISALAEVLLEEALRDCESQLSKRFGKPQRLDANGRLIDTPFSILALGKLGGNELNYSSDIDLLFLYGDGERGEESAISNREYFIRLAQRVTAVLSRVTGEGAVFRIDLRLRPRGREGEPAVSFSEAMRYYSEVAHDWELQALIKIRHAAGDVPLARRFIRGVQPFVYSEQINFEAVETALEARDRIRSRRLRAMARGEGSIDVKLDRGGIRDIEFLVQCLQRVYGGPERWLRSGGTLFSLQKLHDKRHISGSDFHHLTTAYEFLRRVEHRLQLRHGQQLHRLPVDQDGLGFLTRSLGSDPIQSGEHVVMALRERMGRVTQIYDRIIHHQQRHRREEHGVAEFSLRDTLFEIGQDHSERQILERLAADSPQLYEIARRTDLSPQVRRSLFHLLDSAFTSSERYAAVASHPLALERALCVLGLSELLTDVMIRHPEEMAALGDIAPVLQPRANGSEIKFPDFMNTASPGTASAFPEFLASEAVPDTQRLALLRRRYRHRTFVSGARDVIEGRNVYESLAATSAAADEAIAAAVALAGNPRGLAVLALGRLGTNEFDVLSDADLLFVRDSKLSLRSANRAAEAIMEALSAYTQEGTAFAVDARLRPRGAEGELTTTPEQLTAYFEAEAQAWEALSYGKLRLVTGPEKIAARVLTAVENLQKRFAGEKKFLPELRDMRVRLEQSELVPGQLNLKIGPGGMYDIEFILGDCQVRHGLQGLAGNLRERIDRVARAGLPASADCAMLASSAELIRTVKHVVRLVTGRALKGLPVAETALENTQTLTSRILRRNFPAGLEAELRKRLAEVREAYDRLLR